MPRSGSILATLRRYESRNVTFIDPDGSWPIVWTRARGMHVWDVTGRRYLDLTAAFGVAAAGHANPRVIRAGQRQLRILPHAMGDVHPHPLKAQLARELSRLTFERWAGTMSSSRRPTASEPTASPPARATGRRKAPDTSADGKVIFCNSGFEAVEAALKTALLATGRRGVIAFEGAYHGLGYGALNATHRAHFREPFRAQLAEFGRFAPFPKSAREGKWVAEQLERQLRRAPVGAILIEPAQARGGFRFCPPGFLARLRQLCDHHGALLVFDEVYTGFGRTGAWFACEHERVIPDLICLGKALTGGFPLSACVGRAKIMDAAWPESNGEAIHTSTYLGHPVGCAMALAQIEEIRKRGLVQRSARLGHSLQHAIEQAIRNVRPQPEVRGLGLMVGVELRRADASPAPAAAMLACKRLLRLGFIALPEGEHGNVLGLTPPLVITEAQVTQTARALQKVLTP